MTALVWRRLFNVRVVGCVIPREASLQRVSYVINMHVEPKIKCNDFLWSSHVSLWPGNECTSDFNSPFLRMQQFMPFPFVACIIKPPGLYFVNIVCTSSMIELPSNLPPYTFSYTLVYSSSPILFGLIICLIVLLFHQTAAKSLQGETKVSLA